MQKIKLEREMKITHDCGGEFTLPDYVPAIGRILSAECDPAPEGVYLKESDGHGVEAELGGLAVFRILYVPEEGGINGVTIPCDYDTNVVLGPVGGSVICRVSTAPENVFCRVTAPRKLQLRCRLGSRISVLSASDAEGGDSFADGMEVRRGTAPAMSLSYGASRDLLCASDLSGLPEGAVPILCRASVAISECRPTAPGEYRCRGDILIECIYEKEGDAGTLRDRIGFDETVTLDGDAPAEGAPARAFGTVNSVELHTDDSGSRAEIIYELEVEAAQPVDADVVYDAYSCVCPVAAEYDDTEYLSPAASASCNFSVNERIPKNVTGRVVSVFGRADIAGAAAERGRVRVSGELHGCALLCSGGEYDVVPWSVPWSCELPGSTDAADGDLAVWGGASVSALSARADGELAIDAEVTVSVTAAKQCSEHVLTSVKPAGEPFPARGGFTVYYPTKDECVWDIAKRFHVPTSAVTADGNIRADGTPADVVVI